MHETESQLLMEPMPPEWVRSLPETGIKGKIGETLARHSPHSPMIAAELETAWKEGFEGRNGPAWLAAVRKSHEKGFEGELQKYVDQSNIRDEVRTAPEIVIRCIEDRLSVCGCGCAGCGVLVYDKEKGARVPTEEEMAENILKSPAVKNSDKPIVIILHEECGANRLALVALEGGNPSQEDVEKFGRERAQKVVQILQSKLGSTRKVEFREARIGTEEMSGPKGGHPGQMMTVTDFAGDRVLNPDAPGLPKSMQINPNAFASEEDFALHLKTGAEILTGKHGSGHRPVMIIGLTEKKGGSGELRATMERIIATWPEKLREQVVVGVAELRAM